MDCLFCRIVRGELPASIVFEDEEIVAFEDINPQAPVHLLVIPRKHVPTLNDLTPEEDALVGRLHRVAAELARARGVEETGYRVVLNCNAGAGQTVFHIHLHLLGGRDLQWPPG
ncbi:MAG: histidine triad nucleotide-binding protein [Candidatus Latescibacterota bacterium]|nr:MAG: histidine triad nucleotide-binding protein [Candidatus Latescibacterota bacterium]